MHRNIRLIVLSSLLPALLLTGCDEEFPITEGLLKASPPGERNGNDNGAAPGEDLTFTGSYEGETGTAVIDDEDDARLMAESAYLVWHMERLLQGADNLVSVLAERDQFEASEVWNQGFGGQNCGDDNTVTLDDPGTTGTISFDDFCIGFISRTDNNGFTLTGDMDWADAVFDPGGFGQGTETGRQLTFDDLEVIWRGETFRLTGISQLDAGDDRIQSILDVQHGASGQEWRVRSARPPGQASRGDRILKVGSLGSLEQITGDVWVGTDNVNCVRAAASGQARMRANSSNNDADFQIRLDPCDQYNLIEGINSSGGSLANGPWTLLERLF